MPSNASLRILATLLAAITPALPLGATDIGGSTGSPAHLECVPYARQITGIRIFGDAHTWWNQAEGRYARGRSPRVGAVMAFRPHGNSRLGHVAAVSRIIDSRTVLLRHANWSRVNGRRGQIENDVRAIDVSPDNDWSEVRVWYAPIQGLGTTRWPLAGFIYNEGPGSLRLPPPRFAAKPTAKTVPDFSDDPIGEIIARSGASRSR
jgi:surface antigen